jgi:hypothetical protein
MATPGGEENDPNVERVGKATAKKPDEDELGPEKQAPGVACTCVPAVAKAIQNVFATSTAMIQLFTPSVIVNGVKAGEPPVMKPGDVISKLKLWIGPERAVYENA